LDPGDIVVTVTAIGAPAATGWQMLAADYIKAVTLLQERLGKKIVGTMTPQNGCSSSINGWVQAAALGLVVVDAVGDMRAHPTGKMGSIGLTSDPTYVTTQVVVGGKRETGTYLEVVATGSVAATANVLRTAADQAGGFIAAARHPLPASYIKEHAALGGISRAIALGEAMLTAQPGGPEAVIRAITSTTLGKILARGKVVSNKYKTGGGFDIGKTVVDSGKKQFTLHLMNEFMAVDSDGERLTTYPDVITVLSLETGFPLSVSEIKPGQDVGIFTINKQHLPLSTGVYDPAVYPEVEKALGIKIAEYALWQPKQH
jgi:DUF917 family protein